MNLKKGELKVFYSMFNDSEDIDNAIEKALEPFGFHRWASGCETQTNVRDLAFERNQTVERAE